MRCINCRLNVDHSWRRLVFDTNTRIISLLAQWVSPHIITETDYVCQACWEAAIRCINDSLHTELSNNSKQLPSSDFSPSQRVLGHSRTCLCCGRSILRIPSHLVQRTNPTIRQQQICQIICNQVAPLEVADSDQVCHNCYRTAGCTAARMHWPYVETEESNILIEDVLFDSVQDTVEPIPQQSSLVQVTEQTSSETMSQYETISQHEAMSQPSSGSEWVPGPNERVDSFIPLPNYKRVTGHSRHCVFPHCENRDTHIVSEQLRITLVKDFKLYLPLHIRVCTLHLYGTQLWDVLFEAPCSVVTFNAQHVEHVFSFLNTRVDVNFSDIYSFDDDLFYYWVGISKNDYSSLLNEVPSLNSPKLKIGLTALLIKYRNGDSNDRISTLFKIPRRTLEGYMIQVRDILSEQFVPRNLGLNHLSREQILTHNLLIPNGIYGHNTFPIFMWDGTYLFTYKSGNYRFQKNSYSLHKYRNLLKPMMIVLCDGYILDCLGPFKAITSDADIMNLLFNPQEEYYVGNNFNRSDVFIVDRGFRDSINMLQSNGFRVHMPTSLSQGQTQLSTEQANQNRCITICRWVVEVINGHLKRDYKIKSLPHLMQDFKIAAALYNRFATRLKDREDAQEQILAVLRERLYTPNILADLVDEFHLNRRSSNFISLTADANNIVYFPRLTHNELILFSLGTYHIKQAYSYYGEHIRANGEFMIEVCTEIPDYINLSRISTTETNEVSLFRGKIKSRHVGRKIYYIYILIKNNTSRRNGILEYCCNCIVGRRTLGCCAHVMSIVWYMGWARFEDHIVPPAKNLDNVFFEDI